MLNLDYLAEMTLPQVWERGEDLYFEGAVQMLTKDDDEWNAKVLGSRKYKVSIGVENGSVTSWDCNCPYDHGPVCKHVVALALAAEDVGDVEVIENAFEKPPKVIEQKSVVDIDKVPAKDLKKFCKNYAENNPEFIEAFSYFLANNKSEEKTKSKEYYIAQIERHADRYEDRSGFIDYYHAHGAFEKVFDLLEKADKQIQNSKYEEVINIKMAVFEKVSDMCQYIDDSDGMVSDALDDCQETFYTLLDAEYINQNLKKSIFDWLHREYVKEKYQGFYGDDILMDLLIQAAKETGKSEELLPLINTRIENAESNYQKEQLILNKIELLYDLGFDTEANQLIARNLNLDKVREVKLEQLLVAKKLDSAEEIIKGGIAEAKVQRLPGLEIQWYRKLKELYHQTKNKEKEIEVARTIFDLNSFDRFSDLKQLKVLLGTDRWPAELNRIVVKLTKQQDWYFLVELYANEKMTDQQFEVIRKIPQYHVLMQYSESLMEKYGEEMLEMLSNACADFADKASNRKEYRKLASMLEKVKKLKGGTGIVSNLVNRIREVYKRRPAMIEELSKFK